MSWTPTTLPIFVEIGPTGSAPHIAEIQPAVDFVYLSFPPFFFIFITDVLR